MLLSLFFRALDILVGRPGVGYRSNVESLTLILSLVSSIGTLAVDMDGYGRGER